jgi:hypothetical protein
MYYVIKRLAVPAIAVCLVPFAAQAHSDVPRFVPQSAALKTVPGDWVRNFGFLPINCKPPACRVVQKGYWPRPEGCVR